MERPSLQSIPADIAASIQQSLDEVERAHDVRILFAIESGSRAWGFPSPDSDYDVRAPARCFAFLSMTELETHYPESFGTSD